MQKLLSGSWHVLAVLMGLSMLMRVFSFFPSVIDHDESTYILIADALRKGQVYLRDVMDTKPIGIFLLFAFFQTVFGKAIIVIRVITAVWVALTAWMLYLTHRQFLEVNSSKSFNPAPIASGIIYVFITSVYTTYGLSPNTELFFNLFTITALFIMLRFEGMGWFFLAGLLLGIGFIIKYVVLFDAVALGLFYLWLQITRRKHWSYWLVRCLLMGACFLIPFCTVWIYYRHLDLGDTFWFYSFELSSRYITDPLWHDYLNNILTSFLSFLPVMFWFLFCLKNWRTTGAALPVLGIFWGIWVMIIIWIPGRMFHHYFVQFMLPLSLLAGSFFDLRRNPGRAFSWMRNPSIGYPILFIVIMLNVLYQKINFYDRKDYPREVASYLKKQLRSGDILYTGDYQQIIYLLTNTRSPTPYIHSSLIWKLENSEAINISPIDEMQKIIQQHPRFILIRYPLFENNPLYETIRADYTVAKIFDRKVIVYERN